MSKMAVGIVFHGGDNDVNTIKDLIETMGLDIVYIKTSWGKLWIKDGEKP